MSHTELELKKQLEEQLERFLTEQEITFVSWMAEKMSSPDEIKN